MIHLFKIFTIPILIKCFLQNPPKISTHRIYLLYVIKDIIFNVTRTSSIYSQLCFVLQFTFNFEIIDLELNIKLS